MANRIVTSTPIPIPTPTLIGLARIVLTILDLGTNMFGIHLWMAPIVQAAIEKAQK